jgi:hypothetical protein
MRPVGSKLCRISTIGLVAAHCGDAAEVVGAFGAQALDDRREG